MVMLFKGKKRGPLLLVSKRVGEEGDFYRKDKSLEERLTGDSIPKVN